MSTWLTLVDGGLAAGFAHFTPSSGMMPTSRSLLTAPPGSRAGCKPMRADWSLVSSTTASRQGAMSDSALTSASLTPQSPADVDLGDRAAPALRLVVVHEAVDQRLARHHLHLRIERRAHRQAAFIELLLAISLEDLAAHFLGEIFRGEDVRAGRLACVTPSGSLAFSASAALM